MALGLLLALLGSAAGLATPMVTKWVLDSLGSGESLLAPAGVLLALTLGGSVVFLLQWRILGAMGERVVLNARTSMIRRYLRATVPAITKRPSGELVTRVTSDTVLLSEAAASSLVGIVNSTVMLIGTLVLMGVLDLVLLGSTVAAVVIIAVLFALVMPAIGKAKERAQEHLGRLGGTLEGALRAVKTVKANGAEERIERQILTDAETSAKYSIRAAHTEGLAWTIAWTGIQLAIIVVLALGAWRVQDGLLEVSSLIAFLLYAFNLMGRSPSSRSRSRSCRPAWWRRAASARWTRSSWSRRSSPRPAPRPPTGRFSRCTTSSPPTGRTPSPSWTA